LENLKAIRERRNITQVRLSIEIGVSQETISAYESGKALPSIETLCKMANFFNVSSDYLLDRTSIPYAVKDICLDGLNNGETELITHYRQLSKNNRAKAIGMLIGLKQG
jgi:transcriptional regulator with XRE-family HTH domain